MRAIDVCCFCFVKVDVALVLVQVVLDLPDSGGRIEDEVAQSGRATMEG